MYDAIDLGYYRLNGDIRIVEDKFVENFTRRFAENVTSYTNYNINIEDINELPPKVSLSVRTSITSLEGDTFGITNRVDAIIETKYKISDVIDFLGITEEEWLNRENVNSYYVNKKEDGETACKITTKGSEEYECIPGDIEFSNWEDISLTKTACDTNKKENRTRIATYKVCECGKWKEEKEEIESIIVNNGNEYIYKWVIEKEGEIRDIKEETKIRVTADKCVTGIDIYVPQDLREKEPSSDNSKYEKCPKEGIRIPEGEDIVIHGGYTPSDATNRNLTWKSSSETITLQSSNPNTTTGYSKAGIIAKEIGNTTVTATSTNKVTGTCKIEVWDGNVDSVGCNNISTMVGFVTELKANYEPYNSNKTNFKWTSSNTGVATIDETTGSLIAKGKGNTTITVTAPNGKTGTCTIKVDSASVGQICYLRDSVGNFYEYDEYDCQGTYYRNACLEFGNINSEQLGQKCTALGEYSCEKSETVEVCTPVGTGDCAYTTRTVCTFDAENRCFNGYTGCDFIRPSCYGGYSCNSNTTATTKVIKPNQTTVKTAKKPTGGRVWIPDTLNINFNLRMVDEPQAENCYYTTKKYMTVCFGAHEVPCSKTYGCIRYADTVSKEVLASGKCTIITRKGRVCPSGMSIKDDKCCTG